MKFFNHLINNNQKEIKSLDSALTEEEIDKRIAQTEEDNETLTAKVKNIQENTVMIDKDSFDQAQKLLKIAQVCYLFYYFFIYFRIYIFFVYIFFIYVFL